MQRDQGPNNSLGFGVTRGQLPVRNEEEAANPESGIIARHLNDNPLTKFLAVAGATIVSAQVARTMVRQGSRGIRKLAVTTGQEQLYEKGLKVFRDTQSLLDEYEGVVRKRGKGTELRGGKLVDFDDPSQDIANRKRGFFFSEGEKERMRDLGMDAPESWLLRDEIQQRLVSQARRLPYELPAAYGAQRALIDPLMGTGPEEKNNGALDWVGDFAQQSMKNLAFAFLPFEAGTGAATHGWRKALTSGADANYTGARKVARDAILDANDTLGLIGHHTSDLLAKAVQKSQRTTGAMASAISQSAGKQRGLVDHLHQARTMGIGGWTKRVAEGEEVFGPLSHIRDVRRIYKQELKTRVDSLEGVHDSVFKSRGHTKIEEIAASSADLHGRAFTEGDFYRKLANNEYRSIVARSLADNGVDKEIAQKFTQFTEFSLPVSANQKTDLSKRIRSLGDGKIFEGAEDFAQSAAFRQRIEALVPGHGEKVGDTIQSAIRRADREFMQNKKFFDKGVKRTWDESYRNVIAKEAKSLLGTRRMPYGDFGGGMSDEAAEFLVRRSAERAGINVRTASGVRSTRDLKDELRRVGFDPSNRHELRSHLVGKGDIAKPWNPLGYNFFGLRAMSVQEATDRKVFSDELTPHIESLSKAIKQQDYDPNILQRLKTGGLYRTAHGDVLDVTPITQAFRGVMDKLANEVQIPLIHVKPLQMFGYGAKQDRVQFFSGGRNPFLSPEDQAADGYFWLRSNRTNKGRATSITRTDSGVETRTLPGKFRPLPTDSRTLKGRSVRMAIGDTGRRAYGEQGRFAAALDVDDYQPNSFRSVVSRFRGRNTDLNNPAVVARLIREDALPDDPAGVAKGFSGLLNSWRRSSFGPNVVRNLEAGSPLAKIFRDTDGADISKMDTDELYKRIRTAMHDDADALGVDRGMLTRAQTNLLKRWHDEQNISSLNEPIAPSMRTPGIQRRVDQMRMDYMRYMAMKNGMGGGSRKFGETTTDLISNIDEMFGKGLIGTREAAEARAAVGSIHATYVGLRTYTPGISDQQHILSILENMRTSSPGVGLDDAFAKILDDTANYASSGVVKGKIKQRFGISEFEYEGFEFNPFAADSVLTPTFSTAFTRDPLRATLSAAGIGTWRNPQAFSTAGIAPTHLVDRMNRAQGLLGMGIDTTGYGGPLHLLGKGLVGKRVLPIVAAGTTAMALDRTAGAYVYNDRDAQGERIYRPLVTGAIGEVVATGQIGLAGLLPGGQTAEEKEYELKEGEVEVRKGRWWALGNTPWKGGKIDYYRPSWYRRMKAGYQYTDQTYGSPLERLAFGHDFSPLRPLDPYRFERQNYEERPYPVTGDYFTGPWGPVTAALNMTVGKILKPSKMMHEEEMQFNLSRFQQVGAYGMAAPSTTHPVPGEPTIAGALEGYGGDPLVSQYQQAVGVPAYTSGSQAARSGTFAQNVPYMAASNTPFATTPSQFPYAQAMSSSMVAPRGPTNVMLASAPLSPAGFQVQSSELAYLSQEFAGIYGFGFGALRESLGFGDMEYQLDRPVLARASEAYGTSRQFWDLNLGGLGDAPLPLEGQYANLEFSEVARRFIPKPRRLDYINPIENAMGREHPWMPGNEYFTNFKWGDPYTKIAEGEMRLPGQGYERFNELHPDETGRYGRLDRFKILADVAPYSDEYRQAVADLRATSMDSAEQAEFLRTLQKVENVKRKNEFTPYGETEGMGLMGRIGHWVKHQDTYLNTKFMPYRTATEDWERENVYGSSFPQWQNPIEDFLQPALNKAADRSPLRAGAMLGLVGGMFGATPGARLVGRTLGGVTGFTVSALNQAREAITGDRFIPAERRKELALEEYTDILQYTKSLRGFNIASAAGDAETATLFKQQMKQTMYGADLFGATPEELEQAIPKRKREHFREFLFAPEGERERILSTAGRLERRIYQAAWGMRVEKRPDLEDYYADHELPSPEWEGWDPRMNMDTVQLKMLQQQGLNASQMGYYPQQVREANIINPSYPNFSMRTRNPRAELEQLLAARGMSGSVRVINTPFSGTRVNVNSGV